MFPLTQPWKVLLGEEQSKYAETLGECHTDDGLDKNFTGGAGIATDGFGGFGADETDTNGGAEETKTTSNIA